MPNHQNKLQKHGRWCKLFLILVAFALVVFQGLHYQRANFSLLSFLPPATTTTKHQSAQRQAAATTEAYAHIVGKQDSYTVVVVRCKGNLTWFADIPYDWRVVIYDKCPRRPFNITTNHTEVTTFQPPNMGAEECNGYFDFMYDYYDNMTDVTFFMHDDGLWPYSKRRGRKAHTPFHNFSQIVSAIHQFMTKDQGFLHFGVSEYTEKFGKSQYHGRAQQILWPFFAAGNITNPPEHLSFYPSAHFAVQKKEIHRHPRATYSALMQLIRGSNARDGARKICCAMERMWHIFFGLPAHMPKQSVVTDLLNITIQKT